MNLLNEKFGIFSTKILTFLIFLSLTVVFLIQYFAKLDFGPDEKDHTSVAKFYTVYSIPPKMDDPRIINSLSNYGMSYHNGYDNVYFLAGKWASLVKYLSFFPTKEVQIRSFYLLLLFLLFFVFRKDKTITIFLLLLPAQFFFLFSYFNNDSLAVFLSFILCVILAKENSFLYQYLLNSKKILPNLKILLFSLLLALIYLGKPNYWIIIIFSFCFIFLQLLIRSKEKRFLGIIKLSVIFALFFPISYPRIYLHLRTNALDYGVKPMGAGDSSQRLMNLQKLLKKNGGKFKEKKNFKYIQLKNNSKYSFSDIFTKFHWHKKTWMSFLGLFGKMNIKSPYFFYIFVSILYGILLGLMFFYMSRSPGFFSKIHLILFMGTICSTIGISIWHSWTSDFQPQGRYLFPILCFSSTYFLQYKDKLIQNKIFPILFASIFSLNLFVLIYTCLGKGIFSAL